MMPRPPHDDPLSLPLDERFLNLLPVAVYTCDLAGVIRHFNRRAVELWGRTPRRGDLDERFCGSLRLYDADGAPVAHAATPMATVLQTGAPVRNQEIVIERPDGSRVDVLVNIDAVRDADGAVVGAVNVFADVSERRRAEATRNMLAAIVDSSEDAIVSWTLEGVITSWNAGAERLYGYTEAEMLGASITRLIPADRAHEVPGLMNALGAGARVDPYETVRLHRDGRRLDVSVSISPLPDARGRVTGAAVIARDIGERKRTQAALEAVSRRKDEFLATLAHELRNPLAPISTAAELLSVAAGSDEVVRRAQQVIERQVRQMARLVDDLLDLSRITRGKIELRTERVALATVIASAVETAAPTIEARGHALTRSLPPEEILVQVDPTRLAQVLANLLDNAAKYTERGGRIWLSAAREGDMAAIRVRDDGLGIPPEKLAHIFDMFHQAHRDTSEGGLGIGLTLVKDLVALHGGTVAAASDGPGRGSEFVVRLPLASTPSELVPAPAPVRAAPAAAAGLRVLVVDDNVDAASSLADLLALVGHQVREAHDGPSALAILDGFCPDLVLLDLGMPGMDGYQVARALRARPELAHTRVVALTGFGQREDRERTRAAGFDDHLVKPLSPEALTQLLSANPGDAPDLR